MTGSLESTQFSRFLCLPPSLETVETSLLALLVWHQLQEPAPRQSPHHWAIKRPEQSAIAWKDAGLMPRQIKGDKPETEAL